MKRKIVGLWKQAQSEKYPNAWTDSERIAEELGVSSTELRTFLKDEGLWE